MVVLETSEDFGLALRAAREAAGRSLRDVADVTKLGVRTLEALERNQIDRLPPGIFRRAVVRAYAEEVGLDPEDTLRVFLARHPDALPPPGAPQGPVSDLPVRPRGWPSVIVTGLAVGVIVALVVAAYLLWPRPAQVGRLGDEGTGNGRATSSRERVH
ncbi:MAG: helix-turn-helix domain-containing protein [Acidobacteria bacterium]|nr:helix-turn-helix domain-containing protein [Acidobacteriota bacterium]